MIESAISVQEGMRMGSKQSSFHMGDKFNGKVIRYTCG